MAEPSDTFMHAVKLVTQLPIAPLTPTAKGQGSRRPTLTLKPFTAITTARGERA
jgi:hypothetical protein